MLRDLYSYYERELEFMRDLAGEFAHNYPHVAARLDLERHRCDDPHVERLIESFCLIAARIQHRLDADFPEVTQSLLNLVYPHYLRPIPAMSIMQFRLSPAEMSRAERLQIDAHTEIEIGDELCKFQTCYPVDLWPISVANATVLEAADLPHWSRASNPSAGILLQMVSNQPFAQLEELGSLRFYLAGAGHTPYTLYELIFDNCQGILLRDSDAHRPLALPRSVLRPVGFSMEQGILPYEDRSFLGYRLLHEYCSFPNKFLFFDLGELHCVQEAQYGNQMEILILLDCRTRRTEELSSLRRTVTAENFLLGCTPLVNLFPHAAEQIKLDHTKPEYQVIPDNDRSRSLEIYSIDRVVSRETGTWRKQTYEPFCSFRHTETREERAFWHATRRPSRGKSGTEVFLSLVNLDLQPVQTEDEILEIRTTCTNRDLPRELAFTLAFGEVPFPDNRVETRFVHRPTHALYPPLERDLDWRVISLFGLNYLSLADPHSSDPQSGANGLRELLTLYNFSEDPAVLARIRSITGVSSQPTRARITFQRGNERAPVFCHGLAIDMELSSDSASGFNPFLFVSVLERFFALFSPINSFTQLTARLTTTDPRGRATWQWPPRNGERAFL